VAAVDVAATQVEPALTAAGHDTEQLTLF
jgi:hypothetical protein